MLSRAVQDEEGILGHERNGQRTLSVNDTIVEGFLRIHEGVSDKLATPRRYISFIYTYMHIYTKKKTDIQQKQRRLQVKFVSRINSHLNLALIIVLALCMPVHSPRNQQC
jgi:lipopolysaccharide export LptBFGC system permease protein LptF